MQKKHDELDAVGKKTRTEVFGSSSKKKEIKLFWDQIMDKQEWLSSQGLSIPEEELEPVLESIC